MAAQRRFAMIFEGFGPPLGEPRGSLWGSFGRQSLQMERLCNLFGALFGASKKGAKTTKSSRKRGTSRSVRCLDVILGSGCTLEHHKARDLKKAPTTEEVKPLHLPPVKTRVDFGALSICSVLVDVFS